MTLLEMKSSYTELKRTHQEEVNNFPMFFAFNKKQFEEGLEKLNASKNNKVVSIGMGGYMLKSDLPRFRAMLAEHEEKLSEAMKEFNFAVDMFEYELCNHEYCYTRDTTQTLEALGLTEHQVSRTPVLKRALKAAIQRQIEKYG